jgi:predicted ester cyclase
MSLAENKLLVRRYIDEIVNPNDLDRLGDFIGLDYIETGDSPEQPRGPQRAREHLIAVRTTFPDLNLTVGQQIAEGDWVVTRVTARATHLGTWMDIKPTGKRVKLHGVNVDRVVRGRIVEHGGAADMLIPLLQVGAVHG